MGLAQSLAALEALIAGVDDKAVQQAAGKLRRAILAHERTQAQARLRAWRDQRMLEHLAALDRPGGRVTLASIDAALAKCGQA